MKKYIKYLIALIIPFSLASCLKDDDLIGPEAPGAISNIIEFGNISAPSSSINSTYPLYVQSFEMLPSVDLVVPVKIVGVYNPQSDIKVVLEIDNTILADYNTEQEADYKPLQSANYTVPSLEVTIPKGQKSANFVVKILAEKFDFDESYALGLKIKSVSEGVISGNFGNIIVATVPKNLYDGVYNMVSGKVQRYSAPGAPTTGDALNGDMSNNPDITLSSITGTTVEIANLRWAGGTSTIAGIDNLRATVDPVTNLVTVRSVGNASCANIPGAVNKYDPATKTFTLNFDWNQTSNKREVTNLVFKYDRVR